MKDFDRVYETMLGLLEPEVAVKGVENAFADGSLCDTEYEKMRMAYIRLCKRLGCADEDADLNIMVNSLEAIQKALCRQIFSLNMPQP